MNLLLWRAWVKKSHQENVIIIHGKFGKDNVFHFYYCQNIYSLNWIFYKYFLEIRTILSDVPKVRNFQCSYNKGWNNICNYTIGDTLKKKKKILQFYNNK